MHPDYCFLSGITFPSKDTFCLDNHLLEDESKQCGGFDDSRVSQIWAVGRYLVKVHQEDCGFLLGISLSLEGHISSRLSLTLLHSSPGHHIKYVISCLDLARKSVKKRAGNKEN